MWINKKIAQKFKNKELSSCGRVTSFDKNCVNAQTEKPCLKVPVVAPYGVAYVPKDGESTVVMPINGGEVSLGVVMQNKELLAGEIMLYSAGGASLILKNNGKILANGKEI